MPHAIRVSEAFFAGDDKIVVSRDENHRVHGWDSASERELWVTPRFQYPVHCLTIAPNGLRFVTAVGITGKTCTIQQWDVRTGKEIGAPIVQRDMSFDTLYSPDNRLLTVEAGNILRLVDAQTGKDTGVRLHHDRMVTSVAFSPDGKRIATASEDGTAEVWDVATGKRLLPHAVSHFYKVLQVIFSPDGNLIATASSDRTARIWNATTGAPVSKPMMHSSPVNTVQFSPDGKSLATASGYESQLWDVETAQRIGMADHEFTEVKGVAFSPQGDQLLVMTNSPVAHIIPLRAGPRCDLAEMARRTHIAVSFLHNSLGVEEQISWQDWQKLRNARSRARH